MRVFLVEPFYSGSHRAWADGYIRHSEHEVHPINHEGSNWRWRMRGSAVTLATQIKAKIDEVGPPDLLFVSDLVDLSSLLGLLRKELGQTRVALYMHENQLTYPLGEKQKLNEDLVLNNWSSMLAADHVFFNSNHHRDSLFNALPEFLDSRPDNKHTHLISNVKEKSSVLPVGVELSEFEAAPHGGSPIVLWNQRWEHDKAPGTILEALIQLADEDIDFRIVLAGEAPSGTQKFSDQLKQLEDHTIHLGYAPRAEYIDLLNKADIVISAALHEFFGISIVESIAAGCIPILPNDLSYPEIIPTEFHDAALYDKGELTNKLRQALTDTPKAKQETGELAILMQKYAWTDIGPTYDAELEKLMLTGSLRSQG